MNELIPFLTIGLLLISLKAKGANMSSQSLAVKLNNPLNIRHSAANQWNGMVGVENGFVKFSSPAYGFRAAHKILDSYAKRGIVTLGGIINAWAPPSENDTKHYIDYVAKRIGVKPTQMITENMRGQLLLAMAKMESGREWNISTIENSANLV